MKNVRLFAVAAAMGMFASTVAAAEPVTKDAYVATWGTVDEIIKVDVGDKVVLPTAEIKVVKETRTTDAEKAVSTDSLGIADASTCYVGFTNEVGEDKNSDGYVDAPFYVATSVAGWMNTDAKFYPSQRTAMFYLGLTNGGDMTSGRFLAPGAAKKEVYALQFAHQHLADAEAVLAYFEEKGFVEYKYDEDGYLTYAQINMTDIKDEDGNVLGTAAVRLTSTSDRYGEDEIKEAIVTALVGGYDALTTAEGNGTHWEVSKTAKLNYTSDQETIDYVVVDEDNNYLGKVGAGEAVIVEYNRYDELVAVEVIATAGDLKYANKKAVTLDPEKITVLVRNEADKDFGEEYFYNKYLTVKVNGADEFTPESKYVWSHKANSFVKVANGYDAYDEEKGMSDDVTANFVKLTTNDDYKGFYWNNPYVDEDSDTASLVATDMEFDANVLGLNLLKTPENKSDKIVIYAPGVEFNITGLNTQDGTMTLGYGKDKEIKVYAVQLEGTYYPAVSNEEELIKVVSILTGLTKFDIEDEVDAKVEDANDYDSWAEDFAEFTKNPWAGLAKPERTNAEGVTSSYIPSNGYQHYKGTFCTYKLADGEEVAATVTGNVDAIDTTTAGVKTLTLTASVNGTEVATKEVKVVVAPKYERVYKNGKVVKLTAKWLNGNTYAVYNYDWAAKTYTATFYNADGVTVAATSNGTL